MELGDVLARLEAPEALVRQVAGLSFEEAWDECVRAGHRIWLAACAGAAIEALVEAAATAVLVVLERLGDPSPALARAAELAVAGGSVSELSRAAARCEQIAEAAQGTYRIAPGVAVPHAARAAALVARAAEGLTEGEARREAVRLERARARGALLGAGMHAFLPAGEGPARIHLPTVDADPAQSAFLFAVAACAESLFESEAALHALRGPLAPSDLDAIVRGALEDEP